MKKNKDIIIEFLCEIDELKRDLQKGKIRGRHIRLYFSEHGYRCNFQNNGIINIFKGADVNEGRIIQSNDHKDFSEQDEKVYKDIIDFIKFM